MTIFDHEISGFWEIFLNNKRQQDWLWNSSLNCLNICYCKEYNIILVLQQYQYRTEAIINWELGPNEEFRKNYHNKSGTNKIYLWRYTISTAILTCIIIIFWVVPKLLVQDIPKGWKSLCFNSNSIWSEQKNTT